MRKFYLLFPNFTDVSDKLTWSHICELVKIDYELERSFYEKECASENWNVRELRRQMDSGLFLRLAASKDKQSILSFAKKGIEIQTPDSLQLAAAIESNCDVFLTNDKQLRQVEEIKVLLVDDL